MSNIVIKLIISEKADPELHLLLSAIYPRRRAERIRQLAFDGLGGKTATPLKIEKPMEEKNERQAYNINYAHPFIYTYFRMRKC